MYILLQKIFYSFFKIVIPSLFVKIAGSRELRVKNKMYYKKGLVKKAVANLTINPCRLKSGLCTIRTPQDLFSQLPLQDLSGRGFGQLTHRMEFLGNLKRCEARFQESL